MRSRVGTISIEVASAGGLPVSREISFAISSTWSRTISRARMMKRARSPYESLAQAPCAARALSTAATTSDAHINGARPFSWPVDGSYEVISRGCVCGRVWVLTRRDYKSEGTMRAKPTTRRSFNDQTPARGVYASHGSEIRGYYSRRTRRQTLQRYALSFPAGFRFLLPDGLRRT